MKRTTIAEINQIKTLSLQGKNSVQIAQELNRSKKTVRRRLKELGLDYTSNFKIIFEDRTCEYCQEIFNVDNRIKQRFCSRNCGVTFSNINRHHEDVNQYNEIKTKKREEKEAVKRRYSAYTGTERFQKMKEDKLLAIPFEDLKFENRRERVLIEQKYCCGKCGINEWMGQKLSLEVDHIDGNNKNNERENLVGLCPNCHSITPTWRGRNCVRDRSIKLTSDDYIKAYNETGNIRQALLSLGIAGKGGNYKKMYKILDLYNIRYIKQSKI